MVTILKVINFAFNDSAFNHHMAMGLVDLVVVVFVTERAAEEEAVAEGEENESRHGDVSTE
jgi:hypothetical protein